MKGGLVAGVGAVVAIIVAFWLFIVVVKVALKLIGLAIILGLGAVFYVAVRNRIGGGNAR
jgi:hypothetical protein